MLACVSVTLCEWANRRTGERTRGTLREKDTRDGGGKRVEDARKERESLDAGWQQHQVSSSVSTRSTQSWCCFTAGCSVGNSQQFSGRLLPSWVERQL